MGQPQRKIDRKYTYRDYCQWDDGKRWELIEGEAYAMTPAPSSTHARMSRELERIIDAYLEGKPCEMFHAPFDVRLAERGEADDEATTVVQPDILVVCDPAKLDEKGCRGAPDLVIEILSPSNARRDAIEKRRLYERHGVKELWLVDPTNRLLWQLALDTDGSFARATCYADDHTVTTPLFPGLEVALERVFPPLPPRRVGEGPAGVRPPGDPLPKDDPAPG